MPIGHCPMPIAAVYIQAIHGGGQWGTSRMGWDASSILWSYYHISQYKLSYYHISQYKLSYYHISQNKFSQFFDKHSTILYFNHSDLAIKRETGQHLQVLRYLIFWIFISCTLYLFFYLKYFCILCNFSHKCAHWRY